MMRVRRPAATRAADGVPESGESWQPGPRSCRPKALYWRPVGTHPRCLGVTSRSEIFPPHPTSQLLNVAYLFRVRLTPHHRPGRFRMYAAARLCITVGVAVFELSRRADPMRRRLTVSLRLSCLQSKS